jgi:hypothetical protein
MSALAYQPENKFAKIQITNTTARGSPMDNWRHIFFFRSRVFSQYPIKPFSSFVSMIHIRRLPD